ncbi:MAG TPA: DUF6596 domain-containing protein [Streptosporangiales bacterium]
MTGRDELGDLLRVQAPQVLAALLRRYGGFEACEDAVSEALLAATVRWPEEGVPDHPRAWLTTVASRRLVDQVRGERARRRRELAAATNRPADAERVPAPDESGAGDVDDTLRLLFLCCHPALTPASQVALTLRAVGGLTTAEIAQAFLVPEATMAPRISRAKQRIRGAGAGFGMPDEEDRAERLVVVLHVLYLIFNEGYTASSGTQLQRPDLTAEAIRLTGQVHRALPEDGEVAGLLALMLLTDARRPARTDEAGDLVPLAEQDRGRWNAGMIEEGDRLVTDAMLRSPLGPYQLQAAIASLHATAPRAEDTDWEQIRILYGVLARLVPNPVVTVNRAVAVGMTRGPRAGLDLLATLDGDRRIAGHHRLLAVRAHLLELSGETAAAHEAYLEAARRTTSLPEQRHLARRAACLASREAADA